jgi:hypothetical protein
MKGMLTNRGRCVLGLLAALLVGGSGVVLAQAERGSSRSADPMLAGGKKLVTRLAKAAGKRGLTIQPEHTALLLREDAVVVLAPLDGTESLGISDIPAEPAEALPIAFAYLAAPISPSVPDPAAGAVPGGFYLLKVHATEDPAGGGLSSQIRLLLEDAAGNRTTFGDGALVWTDPDATPDRGFGRVDIGLHGQDGGTPPENRTITIRICIEFPRLRICWEETFEVPFL